MHQEVYIDIVFAANLLMDYILLRLTGIVLRRKNSRRRCLAAAAVGALFACLNLYVRPGKTGVLTIVLRVVCAVFMIWIAYEIQDVKHMTGAALFFFGMTFLTGGFWMAVSENRRVTAVFFLSCAASARISFAIRSLRPSKSFSRSGVRSCATVQTFPP